MTGAELAEIVERSRLTKKEFSNQVGINPQVLRLYVLEKSKIPRPVEMLVRILEKNLTPNLSDL